ncbi:hypothetical protein SBADM41S_05069 [Streptomyces badius]
MSAAKDQLRNVPTVLIIPSVMVSITVLSFLMFGDAVRNALDRKIGAEGGVRDHHRQDGSRPRRGSP